MNPTLTKNYIAEGALNPFRIMARGTADGQVVQASAATDTLFGTTGELGAADTERVDVHQGGQPEVEYGGNVSAGDPLTADAVGRAVTAAPGAGANVRIVGFAAVDAVLGDIGPYDHAPSVMQG